MNTKPVTQSDIENKANKEDLERICVELEETNTKIGKLAESMAGLESSIEETVKMLIKKIDEKGEISSEVMFGFTTVVEEVDRAKEVVENVSKSFVAISSHIENDSIHNTKESMQEIAEEKAAEAVKEHAKQEGIHTTTQEKMQFGAKPIVTGKQIGRAHV